MKTIYIDTARHGLIPVKFMGWRKTPGHDCTGLYNAVVKIKRTNGLYALGEVLEYPASHVVVKSHRKDWHQYVKPAPLPTRTEENTLPPKPLPTYGRVTK